MPPLIQSCRAHAIQLEAGEGLQMMQLDHEGLRSNLTATADTCSQGAVKSYSHC